MEKVKKVLYIFLILVIFLNMFFCTYTNGATAYILYESENYSIQLPTTYYDLNNGSYTDDIHTVGVKKIKIMTDEAIESLNEKIDLEEEFYTEEQLEIVSNAMHKQISNTNNPVEIYEEKVVTYSKNNYKGFLMTGYIPVENINFYTHMYVTISGGDALYFIIYSPYEEYFESNEYYSIVDSYTLNEYIREIGEDRVSIMTCLAIITIVAVVVWYLILLIQSVKLNGNNGMVICSIIFAILEVIITIREWKELILINYIEEYAYLIGHLILLWISIILLKLTLPKKEKNKDIKQNEEKTEVDISYQIECKVCGKVIKFNEHGTCEECHKKILKRIEEKNVNIVSNTVNEKNDSKTVQNKKYCTNCGTEIKEDWNFCNNCGYNLK